MPSFEDLETLDNKSLRSKCMEYGLPNVPITDTSRKILIKKLRTAMEIHTSSGSNAKGSKSRRETSHLILASTNVEKDDVKLSRSSNRRTTIGTLRKEKDESRKGSLTLEQRRASRSTPVQETSIPISLPRKNTDILIGETDFDEEFILIDDKVVQPIQTNIPVKRISRSPSLSKSAVVTTSYKKDEKENIVEDETEEEGYNEKRMEYNLSKHFVLNKEKDIGNTIIPRYNLSMTTQTSGKEVNSSGYKSLYPSLNTIDKTLNINSYGTNLKMNEGNYKTGGSKKFASSDVLGSISNNSNSDNSDSNFEDDIVQQAPYLSDFARRLSNLKAEKLDMGIKKEFTHERSSKWISPGPYKSNCRNGVRDSLHQLWHAVNREYKVTKFLFVLALLFLITFVYYYYLQN